MKTKKNFLISASLLISFLIFTLMVKIIDVKPIGPEESLVGFATLEASYPSSTTMLVMCIMPTAMMQFSRLIANNNARKIVNVFLLCFIILLTIGLI